MIEHVPPKISVVGKASLVQRMIAWLLSWTGGVAITGVSLGHLLADRHVWDARVSLPVRTAGAEQRASFHSLGGGEVTLFVTSFTPSAAGDVPFRGAVAVTVINERGEITREILVGPRGTAHAQTMNSAWTTLATLTAPRLWFRSWTLHARVLSTDPAFAAEHLDVLLRAQRRELGMGGMVFYVTIFIGIGLLAVALVVAAMSISVLGRVPLVLTIASLAGCGLVLLI